MTGIGRAIGQRADRGVEALVGQDGGVDPARELAQLGQRPLHLELRLVQQIQRRVVLADRRLQQLERHPHGQEPLLGAVVEIPLEAPALLVAGPDDPGARLAQLEQLGAKLGLQPLVLERQAGGRAGRFEERRLIEEDRIVHDGREILADERDRAVGADRQLAARALPRRPRRPLRKPQRELEGRIADRSCERVARTARAGAIELDDEIADPAAGPPRHAEPDERRQRCDERSRGLDPGERVERVEAGRSGGRSCRSTTCT